MLMTIQFGKGRVFHTTLGRSVQAFKVRRVYYHLQRHRMGGYREVKQKAPSFPTAERSAFEICID
jgi:type 1 glutamine amidotransferase